jgi:prolyl-tRNA editing enzyme YbaK/EbsC (Cys-tRNA(Pro) deacylase)
MTQQLTKRGTAVQEALNKLQLECKVMELPSSTRTALDAAYSIGCDVAQIAKSLIFKTAITDRPILVLASGPTRVDEEQIESHVGEKITKADADFVRNTTGFAIGGIPPVGHKNIIDLIYIDEDLITLNEVWAAAGTPNAVFCIKTEDLISATAGKIINIKGAK